MRHRRRRYRRSSSARVSEATHPGTSPAAEVVGTSGQGKAPADHRPFPEYEGIDGWLILVAIGIVITPIIVAVHMVIMYVDFVSTGYWVAISSPGSEYFAPFQASVIALEVLFNLIYLVAWLCMGYLFFNKRRTFPRWYIALALAGLGYILFDALLVKLLWPDLPMLDPETAGQLFRSLLQVCIWVPYMLVSKRVRATFVN